MRRARHFYQTQRLKSDVVIRHAEAESCWYLKYHKPHLHEPVLTILRNYSKKRVLFETLIYGLFET